MTFEDWLKTVVKIEALRAFVDDAPDGTARPGLEKRLHAQPEAMARARWSYEIEAEALGYAA